MLLISKTGQPALTGQAAGRNILQIKTPPITLHLTNKPLNYQYEENIPDRH